MRLIKGFLLTIAVVIGAQLFSCKGDDPKDKPLPDFDKGKMFENLADNVIIPAYEKLAVEMADLLRAHDSFASEPDEDGLSALRTAINETRLAWQHCSAFEFGPAANENLRLTANTFPVDTAQIEVNISNGEYNLATAQNADAAGFAALEYLAFHTYNVQSNADEQRMQYFKDVFHYVNDRIDMVLDEWHGQYRSEFVSNIGSDAGSSLGMLVNELNYDYELIKNAKVAIPLGLKTLGVPQPEKVEAFYARNSKELMFENLDAIENLFKGANGLGLDDHLDALNATYNSKKLSQAILDGFAEVRSKMTAIEGSLYDAITQEPATVEAAHVSLQNLVVLLKTDMPSQLGVQITYQDNDGD